MILSILIPILAVCTIVLCIILDKRDNKGIQKQIDTLNASEFSKYYKFPLKMWEGTSVKVFTDDNNMAFDWLLPYGKQYNGIKQRLLDRINGYDYTPWAIKKIFYENKDGHIVCRTEEGDNAGNEIKVLLVRGWGMLTGVGGYNLDPSVAAQIQDDFTEFILKQLND
jgi:hypothetical protein